MASKFNSSQQLHCSNYRSKQLIKDAVLDNDFLKKLDTTQVLEIVECMYERRVPGGHYIIREGDSGQHLYVSAGNYSVSVLFCKIYDLKWLMLVSIQS